MTPEDLCYTPATELARRIREKDLSPVEVTEAFLARIDALNPKLNAFCVVTPEQALADARAAEAELMQAAKEGRRLGPLHGVPYTIKDITPVKGLPFMRGSPIYEKDVAAFDHPVQERLRGAGGILLGKTTTPEFGWKGVCDSPVTGITRNPWNLEMTPGGSSGGAGAQVAAGLGPLAQGTDAGGSVRIPGSMCGIFAHKPSHGRVPNFPLSPHYTLATTGPMTRTVADGALMLAVMSGPDHRDRISLESPPEDYVGRLHEGVRGWKIAWSPDLGHARVDPEVARLCEQAVDAFSAAGAHVEYVKDPGWGPARDIFLPFWRTGVAGAVADHLAAFRDRMDPGIVELAEAGLRLPAIDLVKAQMARHAYWERIRSFMVRYDVLLTPQLSVPPFAVGRTAPEGWRDPEGEWIGWSPFTLPCNLSHQPAATVPAGFTASGLPVGLQIIGQRFDDLRVLQAAAAYEQVQPWQQHRPVL